LGCSDFSVIDSVHGWPISAAYASGELIRRPITANSTLSHGERVNLGLIAAHWDELLRLAGSLQLGRIPATGIMRTLQVGDRPTRLAQALAEFGRIDKTLHTLTYLDDENQRRSTLTQLIPTTAPGELCRR
jgi:TnpA family transposase